MTARRKARNLKRQQSTKTMRLGKRDQHSAQSKHNVTNRGFQGLKSPDYKSIRV